MKYSTEISAVIIGLLKGVVYRDNQHDVWNKLLSEQTVVSDYVTVLGLQLYIDENEGFAFLRQQTHENPDESPLPQLVTRRPLSYPVSLLCVLLRKKMAEQDASMGDTRIITDREQIITMMKVFLPEKTNELKILQQVDTCINKLIDLGFLRRLASDQDRFEVKRVIKALVDANFLADFAQKLREYHDYKHSLSEEHI